MWASAHLVLRSLNLRLGPGQAPTMSAIMVEDKTVEEGFNAIVEDCQKVLDKPNAPPHLGSERMKQVVDH